MHSNSEELGGHSDEDKREAYSWDSEDIKPEPRTLKTQKLKSRTSPTDNDSMSLDIETKVEEASDSHNEHDIKKPENRPKEIELI